MISAFLEVTDKILWNTFQNSYYMESSEVIDTSYS